MQAIREIIYSFKAKWFDKQAQLDRHFHIRYYQESNQLEIYDTKSKKLFLKKTDCPSTLTPQAFYLGAKIALFGRQFELIDYTDACTRQLLSAQRQKSVVIVKGDLVNYVGTIVDLLIRQHFTLSAMKMMKIQLEHAQSFYKLHREYQSNAAFIGSLTQSPIVAIEFVAENCVEKLQQYIPKLSSRSLPLSLTLDGTQIETCTTMLEAERYHEFYFDTFHPSAAIYTNCTCAVVLPYILRENLAGQVIEAIQKIPNVKMTAIEMFTLDRATASEFLEIYEGVVPYYNESVDQFVSGPCIAMQLIGVGTEDVVTKFRQNAGPWDVEMAKHLYPDTIRARFGIDRICNAIHCTDLPEDGVLECEYFFDILSKRQYMT